MICLTDIDYCTVCVALYYVCVNIRCGNKDDCKQNHLPALATGAITTWQLHVQLGGLHSFKAHHTLQCPCTLLAPRATDHLLYYLMRYTTIMNSTCVQYKPQVGCTLFCCSGSVSMSLIEQLEQQT